MNNSLLCHNYTYVYNFSSSREVTLTSLYSPQSFKVTFKQSFCCCHLPLLWNWGNLSNRVYNYYYFLTMLLPACKFEVVPSNSIPRKRAVKLNKIESHLALCSSPACALFYLHTISFFFFFLKNSPLNCNSSSRTFGCISHWSVFQNCEGNTLKQNLNRSSKTITYPILNIKLIHLLPLVSLLFFIYWASTWSCYHLLISQ